MEFLVIAKKECLFEVIIMQFSYTEDEYKTVFEFHTEEYIIEIEIEKV